MHRYDIFDVESPNLHYSINVSLMALEELKSSLEDEVEREPSFIWKPIYNFTLRPDQPSGRTPDGKVIAKVQGDLLGGHGLMDLSTKKLLIPSLKTWHHDYLPEEYIVSIYFLRTSWQHETLTYRTVRLIGY